MMTGNQFYEKEYHVAFNNHAALGFPQNCIHQF